MNQPAADNTLKVRCGEKAYVFNPGETVTFGRDASSSVYTDNPLVSHQHARATFDGSRWNLEDLQSKRGVHYDGRKVNQLPLGGAITVWLGPADTGERLTVVAPGKAPKRLRDRIPTRVAVAGLAGLAVVIAIAAVLIANRGGGTKSPNLRALKLATVLIKDDPVNYTYSGSGTIIDEHGLILTNAHVAKPDAPGLALQYGPSDVNAPDRLYIAINESEDKPAVEKYSGTVVAFDGYLDLAVIKIDETTDGTPVDPSTLHLPFVQLGDSKAIKAGAHIEVLGYPGFSLTDVVSVTEGVVSSFIADDRIPDDRALINTDAKFGPGSSGGLGADVDGRIIGIPSSGHQDRTEPIVQGRMKPIHLALPLIEAARNGTTYDGTKYITPITNERWDSAGFVQRATDDCRATTVSSYPSGTSELHARFTFENMVTGQDVRLVVSQRNASGQTQLLEDQSLRWATDQPAAGCLPVDFHPQSAIPDGTYAVTVLLGAGLEQVASESVTVGG